VTLDPSVTIAPVPPRLFGVLVEHMGRCVYEGIFDPGDPRADEAGLRSDVHQLTRELGVSVVRYPGGNFVSGYDWQDGVGPVQARTPRLDLAWRSIEPNTFGLGEFMRWAAMVNAEPMLAVNLGTRGIENAVNLIEYTNVPSGTRYSDLRREHGRSDPYAVRLWCLGNEMDGPWQIGHKSADEYGWLAAQTARAMRRVDPSIELVVCGSSNDKMPTFGHWETSVLERSYDDVDYISLHSYYEKTDDDRVGYLASALAMDKFIESVVATCDHVAAMTRSRRSLKLSFDEWNVETRVQDDERPWTIAPRLSEDEHTVEDAVVVGGLLISLLRHSDRVAVACLAQLVNVMAPIRAERDTEAWRQATFFPFALTARHARGDVLRVEPRSSSTLMSATRGDVEPVDMIATHDPEAGSLTIFAVNRSATEVVSIDAAIIGGDQHRVVEHTFIGGHDWEATNTALAPHRVCTESSNQHSIDKGRLQAQLPAASWTMLRLAQPPVTQTDVPAADSAIPVGSGAR